MPLAGLKGSIYAYNTQSKPTCNMAHLKPSAAPVAACSLHQLQWSCKVDGGQEAPVCEGALDAEYDHSGAQHVTRQHLWG